MNKKVLLLVGGGIVVVGIVVVAIVMSRSSKNPGSASIPQSGPPPVTQEEVNLANAPVSVEKLPYVFNGPADWSIQRQSEDGTHFLLSNNDKFDITAPGVIVIEVLGWELKSASVTTKDFIKKRFTQSGVKISAWGKTAGGQAIYRVDNPEGKTIKAIAYVVEHDSTHVSIWIAEKYQELPILEETVQSIQPTKNK